MFRKAVTTAIKKKEAHKLPRNVFSSETHGKQSAAAQAQSENNGSQKCHQRKRGTYGGKRVPAEPMTDYQSIDNIITLLKKITQNHRNGKQQHRLDDRSFC